MLSRKSTSVLAGTEGFICPNARGPEFVFGKEAVLNEKCANCPQHRENNGGCPGKYYYA